MSASPRGRIVAQRPVIVRLSDFKTNEYSKRLDGANFEPKEENPMLGFRGAARNAHPACAAGFALECAALGPVQEEMSLDNLRIMIPFCRRVDEALESLPALPPVAWHVASVALRSS
jgi:pyruvate, water dikinase